MELNTLSCCVFVFLPEPPPFGLERNAANVSLSVVVANIQKINFQVNVNEESAI